jgi:hypothetical protein
MDHDQQDFYGRFDNRPATLEEGQQETRTTLHQQAQWQQQTLQTLEEIQQYDQQQQANFNYLFSGLGLDFPPPPQQ